MFLVILVGLIVIVRDLQPLSVRIYDYDALYAVSASSFYLLAPVYR